MALILFHIIQIRCLSRKMCLLTWCFFKFDSNIHFCAQRTNAFLPVFWQVTSTPCSLMAQTNNLAALLTSSFSRDLFQLTSPHANQIFPNTILHPGLNAAQRRLVERFKDMQTNQSVVQCKRSCSTT